MTQDVKDIGEIAWVDLTVSNAEGVKDFYKSVIGWNIDAFDMGDYSDYIVSTASTKQTVAGIVHARGENAALPPFWIVYMKVVNLEESLDAARREGGEILAGPRSFGEARFCILKDPAGAVFGIIEGNS